MRRVRNIQPRKAETPLDDGTPLGKARAELAKAIQRIKKERSRESYQEYDKAKKKLRKMEKAQ